MQLADFKLRSAFVDSFYHEELHDGGTLVIHLEEEEVKKIIEFRESIFGIDDRVYPRKVEDSLFKITGVLTSYLKPDDAVLLGVRDDIPASLRFQVGAYIIEAKEKIVETLFSEYEDISSIVNVEFYFCPPHYLSESQWQINGDLIKESIENYISILSDWLKSIVIVDEGASYAKYILNQSQGLFIIKRTFGLKKKNLMLHITISPDSLNYLNSKHIDLKMLLLRVSSKSLGTDIQQVIKYISKVADSTIKFPVIFYLNKAEIYPVKKLVIDRLNKMKEYRRKWMNLAYSRPEHESIQVALYDGGRYKYIEYFSETMVKEGKAYLDLLEKEIFNDNEKESIYVDVDTVRKEDKTALYVFSLFKSHANSHITAIRIFKDTESGFPKKGTFTLNKSYADATIDKLKDVVKDKILHSGSNKELSQDL